MDTHGPRAGTMGTWERSGLLFPAPYPLLLPGLSLPSLTQPFIPSSFKYFWTLGELGVLALEAEETGPAPVVIDTGGAACTGHAWVPVTDVWEALWWALS